jgi:large subunit ribosomal protein L4
MKLQVIKLNGEASGDIDLDDRVFGIAPKTECLADVVRWQLAMRQAGTHAVKTRGFINRSKKKSHRQKGSGNARHGAKTANIFVGGGVCFGPVPRSHSFKINKKVRVLAMKTLLTLRAMGGRLLICEDLDLDTPKVKPLLQLVQKHGLQSALFVDGSADHHNFKEACANLCMINVLPAMGLNVYDGLQHEYLVLSRSAVVGVQERLLG